MVPILIVACLEITSGVSADSLLGSRVEISWTADGFEYGMKCVGDYRWISRDGVRLEKAKVKLVSSS